MMHAGIFLGAALGGVAAVFLVAGWLHRKRPLRRGGSGRPLPPMMTGGIC